MIELYKILTEKYDAAVSSNFVTLRVNELDTRGHHLKIFKERCRLNIKKLIYTPMHIYMEQPPTACGRGSIGTVL